MAKALGRVVAVSDSTSPDYDPDSPHYDVTADPSSKFYVGPPAGDHKSGEEIRAEVTEAVNQAAGGLSDLMLGRLKDQVVQGAYEDQLKAARRGLGDNVELRTPGEPPKTLWANASHEQMVQVINSNADSSAVAVTGEEWVRLGNELSEHQRAFGGAINDSLGNWEGEAGDAARTHLAEVAKWLGSTAEGAVLTGRQQEIHSQALNETQKAMADNPPVPFSAAEANGRLGRITDPVAYAMQFSVEMDTSVRHHAARDQAAQLMHRFDETVGAAATTPKFVAPPTLRRATKTASPARTSTEPTDLRRKRAPVDGAAPTRDGLVRNGGVPAGSAPAGNGIVPNGGVPAGSAPIGNGIVPNGGVPAGTMPTGNGIVPNGMSGGSGMPGGGIPGGGQGVPSTLAMRDFTPSATTASGLTGPSGITPPGSIPTPNVPDFHRTSTVPSGFPGGGNVPGAGYTPPTFSRPSGQDGERTTRFPAGPQNRPTVPTVPNLPGRGFGPGGVPPVSGGVPGGGRFGGLGSVPGMSAGGPSAGGAMPGGGAPGGRAGFGPMGGGGAVGGVAGSRGPGAAAAPMGGGAGGTGGAGGQGEDKEHRIASYLEGDAEILASDEVVSPPVIGDWNNGQDWK